METHIKKAIYKKWWFYVIVTLMLGIIVIVGNEQARKSGWFSASNGVVTNGQAEEHLNVSKEYEDVLTKAKSYAFTMYMSKQGIYKQLTSNYGEGLNKEAAKWAIAQLVVDWNYNALQKAKHYQDTFSMSKAAIHRQLMSAHGEQFTEAEAQYAIDNMDD